MPSSDNVDEAEHVNQTFLNFSSFMTCLKKLYHCEISHQQCPERATFRGLLYAFPKTGPSCVTQHPSKWALSRLAAVQRNILVHNYLSVSSQRYGTTRMQLQRMPVIRPQCRWPNACRARHQGLLWADSGHGAHVHEWQQCADSELCKVWPISRQGPFV